MWFNQTYKMCLPSLIGRIYTTQKLLIQFFLIGLVGLVCRCLPEMKVPNLNFSLMYSISSSEVTTPFEGQGNRAQKFWCTSKAATRTGASLACYPDGVKILNMLLNNLPYHTLWKRIKTYEIPINKTQKSDFDPLIQKYISMFWLIKLYKVKS